MELVSQILTRLHLTDDETEVKEPAHGKQSQNDRVEIQSKTAPYFSQDPTAPGPSLSPKIQGSTFHAVSGLSLMNMHLHTSTGTWC